MPPADGPHHDERLDSGAVAKKRLDELGEHDGEERDEVLLGELEEDHAEAQGVRDLERLDDGRTGPVRCT